MKRIEIESLRPGDIILTARPAIKSAAIRFATGGLVSHAMICVQNGSFIDSTSEGVQARNIQRELFEDDETVFGFRLREPLSREVIAEIVNFARSEIGTRYAVREAIRSKKRLREPRTRQQFCSRLVARAYQSVGISLVADPDYCTPDELRRSPLLQKLELVTETVDDGEVNRLRSEIDPVQMNRDAHDWVLRAARTLDNTIENFSDVNNAVARHPEWDRTIAKAYQDSGFLDLWVLELSQHPWRYDHIGIRAITTPQSAEALRQYCIGTVSEAYSGGARYGAKLALYLDANKTMKRETFQLLITLYDTLVRNDELRTEVAQAWLETYFPDDLAKHMERVEPHSPQWFDIVDRVQPLLGVGARAAIASEKSVFVCVICGDEPIRDYRLRNQGTPLKGVPSLRLCEDCIAIRRASGERLIEF